jgi:hypothetical protein
LPPLPPARPSGLLDLTRDLGGGPDSEAPAPPAFPKGKGFGPPPPPRLALDGWFISPAGTADPGSDLSLGFTSIAAGRRWDLARFTMLGLRPQFQTLFLNATGRLDTLVPDQAYGLSLDIQLDQAFSRKFSIQLGATPGLYTDWQNLSGEAIRVPARFFGSYVVGPKLVLLGGAVYTAQPEFPVVPALGLIWTPSKTWRWELIAPRPRLVYTVRDNWLLYGQFLFDSSTYAIRSNGRDDLLQYRDFRVALGTEWKTRSNTRLFGELGAAFGRRLDLQHGPDHNVDPGVYLRTGLRF